MDLGKPLGLICAIHFLPGSLYWLKSCWKVRMQVLICSKSVLFCDAEVVSISEWGDPWIVSAIVMYIQGSKNMDTIFLRRGNIIYVHS
jgi:hypothetical protein